MEYIIITVLVLVIAGLSYYDNYKKTVIREPKPESATQPNEEIFSVVLNSNIDFEELKTLGFIYANIQPIPFFPISIIIRGNKITSFGFYQHNHFKDINALRFELKNKK